MSPSTHFIAFAVSHASRPYSSAVFWPDAVLPIVVGNEVAARIAHDGHAQFFHEREHVAAEAVLVRSRMARLVDAVVNGASEVLDERAVNAWIDFADFVFGMKKKLR